MTHFEYSLPENTRVRDALTTSLAAANAIDVDSIAKGLLRNKTPFDGKQGESNVKLFEDMQRSLTMDLTAKSVHFGPLLDLTMTVPLATPENELPWLKQYNEKLFAVLARAAERC